VLRLPYQVRERIRYPRDMGGADVEAFLTMLANERQVSPATHRQAPNGLMSLYRDVLYFDMAWTNQTGRSLAGMSVGVQSSRSAAANVGVAGQRFVANAPPPIPSSEGKFL